MFGCTLPFIRQLQCLPHRASSLPQPRSCSFLCSILHFIRSLSCCPEVALFPPNATRFCLGGRIFTSICILSATSLLSLAYTASRLSSTFHDAPRACSPLYSHLCAYNKTFFFSDFFFTWSGEGFKIRISFSPSSSNLFIAVLLLRSDLLDYLRIILHYSFLYPEK